MNENEDVQPPINADDARCREVLDLMDRFPVIRQLVGERDAAIAELAAIKATQAA